MRWPRFIRHWRAQPDLTEVTAAEERAAEQKRRVDELLPCLLEVAQRNHFKDRIAAAYKEAPR